MKRLEALTHEARIRATARQYVVEAMEDNGLSFHCVTLTTIEEIVDQLVKERREDLERIL